MTIGPYEQFENDVEYILGDKLRASEELCRELWSALANVEWYYIKDPYSFKSVSYSFRAAGGLIAEILDKGDYLDWYCSGDAAVVSTEIGMALKKMGWIYDNLNTVCDVKYCINKAGYFGPYGQKCSIHYKEV